MWTAHGNGLTRWPWLWYWNRHLVSKASKWRSPTSLLQAWISTKILATFCFPGLYSSAVSLICLLLVGVIHWEIYSFHVWNRSLLVLWVSALTCNKIIIFLRVEFMGYSEKEISAWSKKSGIKMLALLLMGIINSLITALSLFLTPTYRTVKCWLRTFQCRADTASVQILAASKVCIQQAVWLGISLISKHPFRSIGCIFYISLWFYNYYTDNYIIIILFEGC